MSSKKIKKRRQGRQGDKVYFVVYHNLIKFKKNIDHKGKINYN